jgi:hypothetical protein
MSKWDISRVKEMVIYLDKIRNYFWKYGIF